MSPVIPADPFSPVLLRAGASAVLLSTDPEGTTGIVHWGADLGDLDTVATRAIVSATEVSTPRSALDVTPLVGLIPQSARGWAGRACLVAHRVDARRSFFPRLRSVEVSVAGAGRCRVLGRDDERGIEVVSTLVLDESGVLTVRHEVRNLGEQACLVDALLGCLPLPGAATEVLDLSGRWCRERHPQRLPLHQGAWVRDSRHGRTGHDAPLLMVAGTKGFGFRTGQVWAVHTAWSGDYTTWVERQPTGEAVLGGGELLAPDEICLEPGESYVSPAIVAAWSDMGLDGLSQRLHAHLRSRPDHPRRDRPVVLNTWEAVYFDHDLDTMTGLATAAAAVGVERFVLDDGWFRGRRDDRRALGDWWVDEEVWPDGLHPLVDHVTGLGMEFGLWVEPEMISLDSDTARLHPDWVLRSRAEAPPSWRHQQVINLQEVGAYAHVRDRLVALLDEYDISFLKWDMNRDIVDVPGAVHGQTVALYRLLDELRAHQPGLEIETCASGGARVDLAILERTDRVWVSDCNDALERQSIQRWTGLLLPLELSGTHVGPAEAHTTGRRHRLGFRAATALFGHFGLECDVTRLSDAEQAELAGWIELYKAERRLLHTGTLVRTDHPDPSLWVYGVVSADQDRALFTVAQVATSSQAVPKRVRLPGLAADRRYDVTLAGPEPADPAPRLHVAETWWGDAPVRLPGSALEHVGVQLPTMTPDSALVLKVTTAG